MSPWRKQAEVEGWVKRNLNCGLGRLSGEGALIIVGPRLSGKTTWARRFGEHIYMGSLHCPTAMEVDHHGYIVCDDMTKEYPYAKQMLSCQPVLTVVGDDGRANQKSWGRPCIWVCDEWDDPRKWGAEMAAFISQVCTVFDMRAEGWGKMYEMEVADSEAEGEQVSPGGEMEEEEDEDEEEVEDIERVQQAERLKEDRKKAKRKAKDVKKVTVRVDEALSFLG